MPAARQHRIRYEDLVRDPADSLRALCGFLDRPFHPAVTAPYDARRERMREALANDPKLRGHGRIDAGLADAWRGDATVRSLTLTAASAATAARLGYWDAAGGHLLPAGLSAAADLTPHQLARWLVAQRDPAYPTTEAQGKDEDWLIFPVHRCSPLLSSAPLRLCASAPLRLCARCLFPGCARLVPHHASVGQRQRRRSRRRALNPPLGQANTLFAVAPRLAALRPRSLAVAPIRYAIVPPVSGLLRRSR